MELLTALLITAIVMAALFVGRLVLSAALVPLVAALPGARASPSCGDSPA